MSVDTSLRATERGGSVELQVPPRPRNRLRTALIVLALVAMTVATCIPAIGGVELDLGAIVRNWRNGADKLVQLLQPNFEFLPRTVQPMLETLQMAIVGAFVAAIVSVPLTLWAAKPTNPNSFGRGVVRTIINVVRSVPTSSTRPCSWRWSASARCPVCSRCSSSTSASS
jgi:phosphonate transport system permease protein